MKHLNLSSKAKTLEDLKKILKNAEVLPLVRFYAVEYKNKKEQILKQIKSVFKTNLIVRSSSSNEDNLQTSNAGGFDSILDIDINSKDNIDNAIVQVIDSYQDGLNKDDEVFIQSMLTDVTMSGVIFTCDIDTLAPYYIVNYDESGSTSSVTSGGSNSLKTYISFKNNVNIEDKKLKELIVATRECEEIFNNKFLDIEFAFSKDKLFILQVRAIVIDGKENLSSIDLSKSLYKLNSKIDKLNSPHPNLLGDKTIFGVMPDWNPAEIIGIRPKRLALSLYKELITDETWAYQRDNYGYRNLRSHPLLVSFLGVPFIDVRISFNSFIPKDLDEDIASKLVNYYLDELSKNINHHDKVEFEIIYSCYYFDIENQVLKLKNYGFNDNELDSIKLSLLNLTNNIIDVKNGLYKKDINKIEVLKTKFRDIVDSDLPIIDKIYWLIKDVKRYGTLPFAGVARAGFIAIQMLQSFVDNDILSQNEYNIFLNSLNTVSKQLANDINSLDKEKFLEVYGHLRPGTYDITSSRYDEAYDSYFGKHTSLKQEEKIEFKFSSSQKAIIEQLITINRLKTNFNDLMIFIKEAIEGREYLKFVFTKHLSQILLYIEEFGDRFDITTDNLAYLDIQKILNLYSTLDYRDVKDILETDILKNKEFYNYTKTIKLPSVIVDKKDIYSFFLEEDEANFITLKKIKSSIVIEKDIKNNNLKGKIVCIQSADPGYDYLFSKSIGGLITCYGGANSHMAIRCAEMGIPAIIGCGESSFSKYLKAQVVEIDALNKQVKILS
jgi:phosphoenolpyruvate synthase/pyruvate phosphate dikinase